MVPTSLILYHGLGGNDVVTLPDKDNYKVSLGVGTAYTLGWTDTTQFYTDSEAADTYKVFGGTGSYNVHLGAGTDSVSLSGSNLLAANGNSTIYGSTGANNITIIGNGNNTIIDGSGKSAVTLTGGGENTIFGGFGDNKINVIGNGDNHIIEGSGKSAVTLTGTGQNTIDVGTGSDTLNLSGSQQCVLNFTGDNETITLSNLSGFTGSLVVNGFNSTDEIDFTQKNITTCATYDAEIKGKGGFQKLGVPGEIDVYSGPKR